MTATLENTKYLSESLGLNIHDSYNILNNSASLEEALQTCSKQNQLLRKNRIISDGSCIYKVLHVCSKKNKASVGFSEMDSLFGKDNYSLNLENKVLLESINLNSFKNDEYDSIYYYTYLNKKIIVANKFNPKFRLATKEEKFKYQKEKQKQIKKWIETESHH